MKEKSLAPTPLSTVTLALSDKVVMHLPHIVSLISCYLDGSMDIALHEACATGSLTLLNRIWCHSQRPLDEGSRWCPTASLQTVRHYRKWQFSQSLIQAIRKRDLVVVKWILGRFRETRKAYEAGMSVVEEAASTGQLDILKVLLDEDNRSQEAARLGKYDGSYIVMRWGGNDMTLAVMNGHSDVVRWLLEHTRRQNDAGALYCAAECGNLPIVQLLIPRHPRIDRRYLASLAAKSGHLELLQWIVEHVLDGDKNCVRLSGRHLNVNKWLVASNLERGAEQALREACEVGHLPIVKWLTDYCASTGNFFSCDKAEYIFRGAVLNGHLEVVKWLIERGFSVRRIGQPIYYAASRGHLEVVKYLHTQNFKANHRYALLEAAKTGHLALVQWSWTQFKDDPEADLICLPGERSFSRASKQSPLATEMAAAASNGHFEVVQYLYTAALTLAGKKRKRGGSLCKLDMDDVVTKAAEKGHLNVVQWVCTHSTVNSTKDAMVSAAGNGHFPVIQWLHENRPRENIRTEMLDAAARSGDLSLLKWLIRHGLGEGYSTLAVNNAAQGGHVHVLRWLLDNESLHQNNECSVPMEAMSLALIGGHFHALLFVYYEFKHWSYQPVTIPPEDEDKDPYIKEIVAWFLDEVGDWFEDSAAFSKFRYVSQCNVPFDFVRLIREVGDVYM